MCESEGGVERGGPRGAGIVSRGEGPGGGAGGRNTEAWALCFLNMFAD